MIDASLQRILDGVNAKLARQQFEKLKALPVVAVETDFKEYLEKVPPVITPAENIWYYYIPAILKGAALLLRGTVAGNAAELLSQLKGGPNMNPSQINITTNIIGLLLAILEPVRSYLTSQPFDWGTFVACILGAGIAYYTGKATLAKEQGK